MKTGTENKAFLSRICPETGGSVVGYGNLIDMYNLVVPLPERLSFISQRHRRYETPEWDIYTPRHEPEDSLTGHLTFALRYEGVELPILAELFKIINPEIVARWVRSEPTGRYSRRAWFFYEWLTGTALDVPDTVMGNYIYAVDEKLQYGTQKSTPSRRHRVNNNLPGSKDFCPLIRHSKSLESSSSNLRSNERDNPVKQVIRDHFQIPDQELHQLIRFLDQNFKRYDKINQ